MNEKGAGSYIAAATELQQQIVTRGLNLSGNEYEKKVNDIIARKIDNWLTEYAEEFGYTYSAV